MKIAVSGEHLGRALPSTFNISINYFRPVSVKLERQAQNIVVVGSLVTTSLERLLTSSVPGFSIYGLGRDRLRRILRSPKTRDLCRKLRWRRHMVSYCLAALQRLES